MSKVAVTVGVVVLLAGAGGFYAQSRANAALRREVSALRDEVRLALATATAGPTRGANSSSPATPAEAAPALLSALPPATKDELTRLREEIAALRKSTTALTQLAETAQAAKDLAKASESVAVKLIPASQWKNAGKATPEASTESVLWAAVGGDVDTLSNAITFTPEGRVRADAWFAGLSEGVRQQYGSPEKVIALLVARDAAGLSGMQVLGQKEIGPDNVGVRVRVANNEGNTKDETFVMRRVSDGYRMLLSDAVVEKFARKLGGK
jgi:hypothetical protein